MAEPGTLEKLAVLLGDSLAPLTERLQPDDVRGLLAELGLSLPASVVTPQLQSALGASVTAAASVPALVTDLVDSIEADAGGLEIGAKSAPLLVKVVTLIESFDTIADEVSSLTIAGLNPADLSAFAAALPGRLLDYLLITNIERRQPTLGSLLALLGVVDDVPGNVGSTDPFRPETVRKALRLDRLGTFFSSPEQLLDALYGWGTPALDTSKLLDRVYDLLTNLRLPVARGTVDGPTPRPSIEFFLARLAGTAPGINPPGLEAVVQLAVGDGFAVDVPIANGVAFSLAAKGGVAVY